MHSRPILLSLACLAAACSRAARPEDTSAAATELRRYDSCSALEAGVKEMLVEDIEAHFDMERDGRWAIPVFGDGGPSSAPPQGREEGKDYSGTNDQEQGVDEADF